MQKRILGIAFLWCFCNLLSAQTTLKRPLRPSDVHKLLSIGDPQVSPEGNWVAYTLTTIDSAKDKRNTDIWMLKWGGQQTVQLTFTEDSESNPRWSPDGKYLSFLSSRQGLKSSQIWLMNRLGGEAKKLTDIKEGINSYAWSPDGKRVVMVIKDPDPKEKKDKPEGSASTAQPIVIDRYQFKQDGSGYSYQNRYNHLYIFNLETQKIDTITTGRYDNSSPAWSPDGQWIAFVSNRTEEPDRNNNSDIWIVEAKQGAVARQLTSWTGYDRSPEWSPDGKSIAYLRATSPEDWMMYDQAVLAMVPVAGGAPKLLSGGLDRPVSGHKWSKDGKNILAFVADDRRRQMVSFPVNGSSFTQMLSGDRSFFNMESHPDGHWLLSMSDPSTPMEFFALENGNLRRLTKVHEPFLDSLQLSSVEGFSAKTKDGIQVNGLLYKPADATNLPMPTILYIHGGPVAQDEFSFDLTRQMLAAQGYAVAAINYRGSSGRGLDFTKAIYADWGNKEVTDILAVADHLVASGVADPNRLGIGGWSYGGILTDYTCAKDGRFKAAFSGAGSALQLSMYGSDQYVLQYEKEIGRPWENLDKWLDLSYAFIHVDKIKTPTLYMVGEKDFNVPAAGSEQMYQALRSLGVPTGLVIYPGQFHGISTPSYQQDRFDRMIGWFDKYLRGNKP